MLNKEAECIHEQPGSNPVVIFLPMSDYTCNVLKFCVTSPYILFTYLVLKGLLISSLSPYLPPGSMPHNLLHGFRKDLSFPRSKHYELSSFIFICI